jgi:hypothetical protein
VFHPLHIIQPNLNRLRLSHLESRTLELPYTSTIPLYCRLRPRDPSPTFILSFASAFLYSILLGSTTHAACTGHLSRCTATLPGPRPLTLDCIGPLISTSHYGTHCPTAADTFRCVLWSCLMWSRFKHFSPTIRQSSPLISFSFALKHRRPFLVLFKLSLLLTPPSPTSVAHVASTANKSLRSGRKCRISFSIMETTSNECL